MMIKLPNIDYIHNKLLLVFQMRVMKEERFLDITKTTYFSIFFGKKVEVYEIDGKLDCLVFTHYYSFTIPGAWVGNKDATTQTQRVVEVFNSSIYNYSLELTLLGIEKTLSKYQYTVDKNGVLMNYEDSDGNYYDSTCMSHEFMFTYPMDIINSLIDGLETRNEHYAIPTRQEFADEFDREITELRNEYQNED